MALRYAVDVVERQPPTPSYLPAVADTARSLRRTHATLFLTRPLTGRPDTDTAVAAALNAFPAALTRVPTRRDSTGAHPSRTATPTEAVAGGIASLQRLAMRARLYADELMGLEAAWLRPVAALLREFGQQCDTLSYQLRPARYTMEAALTGLDALGAGRGALSHFSRSGSGACAAVHAEAFLGAHPEHRAAFATHVARATRAYADAEAARDRLAEGLDLILAKADEIQPL